MISFEQLKQEIREEVEAEVREEIRKHAIGAIARLKIIQEEGYANRDEMAFALLDNFKDVVQHDIAMAYDAGFKRGRLKADSWTGAVFLSVGLCLGFAASAVLK